MVVLGIWAGYSAINTIFSSPRGTAKFEHPYTALIFAEKNSSGKFEIQPVAFFC